MKKITIKIARLKSLRKKGESWEAISVLLGVSKSSIGRCWNSDEDMEFRLRRKPNRSQEVEPVKVEPKVKPDKAMGTVNRALKAATSDASRMQARLVAVLLDLRAQGVSRMTLDTSTGEAEMVYTKVQTVKVQP